MQVNKFGHNNIMVDFDSITEFVKYINETEVNRAFRSRAARKDLASMSTSSEYFRFTNTHDFEEASNLLKHGWSEMAQKLNKQLVTKTMHIKNTTKRKTVYDVVGHQAIVPLYLQGVPQNMAHTKMVSIPNKVITIDKCIGVLGDKTTEQIIEGSIKAMQIIRQLEAQGYRINLNLIAVAEAGGQKLGCRIKVKKANEKLNISKLAFPMIHPSMHRRMVFRFREVFPETNWNFSSGYGATISVEQIRQHFASKDAIVIPLSIDGEVTNIKTIDDLKAKF